MLGASNTSIKELRRLVGRRRSRLDAERFVIEGPILVDEAIAAGVDVEAVYVDESWAIDAHWHPVGGVVAQPVVEGVLSTILSTQTPQPVCAVAGLLDQRVEVVVAGCIEAARPLLVLDAVGDPGNVGTLLRAAEASGCAGAVLTSGAADLYNPKTVRASAGSIFRLPVAVGIVVDDLLDLLADRAVPAVAAVARGGVPHLGAPLGGAVALVLGSEAHGLAPAVAERCDERVTIAMEGPAESLNVAMAGTVLAFEALRQRTVSSGEGPVGHNGGHERH